MRKPSLDPKTFSRRRFVIGGAAAAMLASTDTRAADIRYRLGLSQPEDSPNYIRLKEMADHIRAETGGRMQIDVYPAGKRGFDNGFHHLTTSTKPVRTVDDLVGMKIRTPVQKMTVEFFESLGAKPMTFTLSELYRVCKERIVDGQTDPLGLIVLL